MDRSIAIGLASFFVTASLLAIPAIATEGHAMRDVDTMSRAQVEAHLAERFVEADADGSGSLNRDEFAAQRIARMEARLGGMFERMDADGDGEISVEERDAAHARMAQRRNIRRSDMIAENYNMRARLTEEELAPLREVAPPGAMADPESAPAANRHDRHVANWASADADGNGSLNASEFQALHTQFHRPPTTRRPSRFDRMDNDRDGRISLEEFSARRLAMFDRADADSDGTVTREERSAARRAWREEHRERRTD